MTSLRHFESAMPPNRKIALTEDGAKTSNIEHRISNIG